jgi:hypothetical protein
MERWTTSSPPRIAFGRRLGLPMLLTLVGVSLLVGCIYIPIPEHGTDWSRKDFRPLIAEDNASAPIRRGKTTRGEITQLLGTPEFELPGDRALVFRYDTSRDFMVGLCDAANPEYQDSFAVKFTFDANSTLVDWQTVHRRGWHFTGGAVGVRHMNHADATLDFRPGYKAEDDYGGYGYKVEEGAASRPAATQPASR